MKLKACGMRDTQNIQDLLVLKPDYMGFIFYGKSPRDATGILDASLLKSFPTTTKKVGVFVNEDLNKVLGTVSKFNLDLVQLHGDESVAYVQELFESGISVIKVFSVGADFDLELVSPYEPYADYFLFDTKGGQRGGTGEKFDWELLKNYNLKTPFFISGGIGIEDIDSLKRMNPYAVDVNSKFEIEPGLKNIENIGELEKIMRQPS